MSTAAIAQDLTSTVESAAARLCSLDEATVSHRPAPDRWTIKEVIGHLIDSATNNHQRFVRAQAADVPVFAAHNRVELVFPAYEQNHWVRSQAYNDVNWVDLVELWRRYNSHLAHVIRSADTGKLLTICVIGDYPPKTLRFLMEDYVVHIKHHLNKIAERLPTEPAGSFK